MRALLAAWLLLATPAALAAEPAAPAAQAPQVAPGVVDGETAHRLVAAGVKVVDVRTPDEFQAGHVPGAVNVPHDQIAARAAELGPPTTALLLYCRSGKRSGLAVKALREKGFTRLYDLQSYDRWLATEPKR